MKIFRIPARKARHCRLDPHYHDPYFTENMRTLLKQNCVRVSEVCELSDEIWNKSDLFQDVFPYIEIGAIDTATGLISGVSELATDDAPSRAQMVVRGGDLLVSMTRPTRNAIAIVPSSVKEAIASTGFAVVRGIDCSQIEPVYLFHVLRMLFCTKCPAL